MSSPTTTGRQINMQKHLVKTKVCSLYLEGKCFYGNKCYYAHCVDELREQPNLFKTSLCKMFRKGMCTHGSNCRYAHGTRELKHSHKTVLCLWWLNGHCTHGDKCRFAHGDRELKGRKDQSEAASQVQTPAPVLPSVQQPKCAHSGRPALLVPPVSELPHRGYQAMPQAPQLFGGQNMHPPFPLASLDVLMQQLVNSQCPESLSPPRPPVSSGARREESGCQQIPPLESLEQLESAELKEDSPWDFNRKHSTKSAGSATTQPSFFSLLDDLAASPLNPMKTLGMPPLDLPSLASELADVKDFKDGPPPVTPLPGSRSEKKPQCAAPMHSHGSPQASTSSSPPAQGLASSKTTEELLTMNPEELMCSLCRGDLKMCFADPPRVFAPCGHSEVCVQCAWRLKAVELPCPSCAGKIQDLA